MTDAEDMIVSESEVCDENDVDVRESTESASTEDNFRHLNIILRVLRRVFSIELVAFMFSFSSGLHSVIRLSVHKEVSTILNNHCSGQTSS